MKFGFILQVLLLLFAGKAFAQSSDNQRLLQQIDVVVQTALPACVKLYQYDTVAKQQAGGQFSGVVVNKEGYILSAAHVVSPGYVYKVIFPDAKECLATGLGKIELAADKTIPDAAMLKIITPGIWPFAEIGQSSSLKIDDPCISISYPESLDQPKPIVRFGYISNIKNGRGFIKSSCMMEPGDSGGPLFNIYGHVIGLHSAIEAPEDSNYDVPVDVYTKYWSALNIAKIYTDYPKPDSINLLRLNIGSALKHTHKHVLVQKEERVKKNCVMTLWSNLNGHSQKIYRTLITCKIPGSEFSDKLTFIVSKSSMVGADPVIINNKRRISVRVLARDKENDLVLLQPKVIIKGGLAFAQLSKVKPGLIEAGRMLVSVQPDTSSILSICGSPVFSLIKRVNAPFLGMGFKNKDFPIVVTYLFPNLNKSIYGVNVGDTITSINGYSSESLNGYMEKLIRYWPGDTINLRLKRAGIHISRDIILDTLPQRHFNHPVEFFAGGKSKRRDGFNQVFTHDAIIIPEKCGGPVFDLDGKFYGINIARYSRASCLVIPAAVIMDFVRKLKVASNKLQQEKY